MKDYLQIHTTEKKIMTLQIFKTILEHLPKNNFLRVHKSYIVSVNKIDSVERKTILIRETKIPIGDTYREHFFYMLKSRDLIV